MESYVTSQRPRLANLCLTTPSAVDTESGYELEGLVVGIRVPVGARFLSFAVVQTGSRTYQLLSLMVKRPGRRAGHSPPASSEGQA
jgi:hypothetical protein